MKTILSIILFLSYLCSSGQPDIILGKWVGEMNGRSLIIVIDDINGSKISGYNILGSNKRYITGTFTTGSWDQPCSKSYEATLKEPGDDLWDGVFTIKFVGYEDMSDDLDCEGNLRGVEAPGEWGSNNGGLKRNFYLSKK